MTGRGVGARRGLSQRRERRKGKKDQSLKKGEEGPNLRKGRTGQDREKEREDPDQEKGRIGQSQETDLNHLGKADEADQGLQKSQRFEFYDFISIDNDSIVG